MIRKTLIVLAGTLAFASAAIAQERDGDGNRVAGVSASWQAPADMDRSFAGPRHAASGVSTEEAASFARQSLVH
jgi:hypothetical protein